MASICLDQNGDCVDKISVEHLLHLDSSDSCDDFEEPDILPRIGDEYQLEIPPSIEKSIYIFYTRKNGVHSHLNFFVGLPIPVRWIDLGGVCTKQDAREEPKIASDFMSSEANNKNETEYSNNENFGINMEASHYSVDNRGAIGESENLPPVEVLHKSSNQGYFLVPGLFREYWSDIEKDGFLLGLYIFEKNFVQIRQFIESKEMGAILSFYYGKFYGTDKYRRWSEGRKMKNKKCVYGHKIFSGLRQQEFLSRILPNVSEECQKTLLEVSKLFGEGKMSLQDYVSSLKAMVGMNVLAEAIAIGKGKQDLTGMALETSRSNQVAPMFPEIPTGKACSSLTTAEIIKFLTGDYRLSKARSNDLFWEAVWPRLLARGWHSEEPKNQAPVANSKLGLVFLIPGVKKFKRRKLVKGDHYFDSVSDVLSKVAKDPQLLELETEEDDGNKNKETRHCYLQPRTPNRNSEIMKFTVVDTSLPDGEPFKVRELRSLPFEISDMLTSRKRSKNSAEESTEEMTGESDTVDTVDFDSGETYHDVNFPYQDNHTNCPDVDNILLSSLKNRKDLHDDKQSSEVASSSQDKLSSTSSPKGSSIGSVECTPNSNMNTAEAPLENPQTQPMIDLNFPQVPTDLENGFLATGLQNSSPIEASYDQQSSMNMRRQSTRNRPPTTRALEALASGYLTVNRRGKRKNPGSGT